MSALLICRSCKEESKYICGNGYCINCHDVGCTYPFKPCNNNEDNNVLKKGTVVPKMGTNAQRNRRELIEAWEEYQRGEMVNDQAMGIKIGLDLDKGTFYAETEK